MTLIEIFRESKALKRLLVERSLQYKIPFRYICAQAGIEYTGFMNGYINTVDGSKSSFTEEQMVRVMEILGVTVRFNFVIDNDIDMVKQTQVAEDWFNDGAKNYYLDKKFEIANVTEKEGDIAGDQ